MMLCDEAYQMFIFWTLAPSFSLWTLSSSIWRLLSRSSAMQGSSSTDSCMTFGYQLIQIIWMLNGHLVEYCQSAHFRLDGLLPNYVVLASQFSGQSFFDEVHAKVRKYFQLSVELFGQHLLTHKAFDPRSLHEIAQQVHQLLLQEQFPEGVAQPIRSHLCEDLRAFVFSLSKLFRMYTLFLKNFFFDLIEKYLPIKDIVDESVNLNWFLPELSAEVRSYLKLQIQTGQGLFYGLVLDQLELTQLILNLNHTISKIYKDCQYHVQKLLDEFQDKNYPIINRYLLITLIEELSLRSFALIDSQLMKTSFYYSDAQTRQLFSHFVIFNSSHLNLVSDPYQSDNQDKFESFKAVLEDDQTNIECYLSTQLGQDELTVNFVQRKKDLRSGICLQTESQSFLVHREDGKLQLLNSRLVGTRWTITKCKKLKNFQVFLMRNDLQDLEEEEVPQEEVEETIFSQGSYDMNCSFGSCLANINRYHSRKEFLKDFGQSAAINGSMTCLIMQMPILGKLLAVGGLGILALRIYANDSANDESKKVKLNKLLIGAGTGVSTSLAGAFCGQALIPVPILGAVIGGFLGSMVAETTTSILFERFNEEKSVRMVERLEGLQSEEGAWREEDMKEVVSLVGLKMEYFLKCVPSRIDERRWLSVVVFCFLTVFYCQQERVEDEWPRSIEGGRQWVLREEVGLGKVLEEVDAVVREIIRNL